MEDSIIRTTEIHQPIDTSVWEETDLLKGQAVSLEFDSFTFSDFIRKDEIISIIESVLDDREARPQDDNIMPSASDNKSLQQLTLLVHQLSKNISDINKKISSVCIQFEQPKSIAKNKVRHLRVDELRATLYPTNENQHLRNEHKQSMDMSSINSVDQKMAFLEMHPHKRYNYNYQKVEHVQAHPGGLTIHQLEGDANMRLQSWLSLFLFLSIIVKHIPHT